MRSIMLPSDAPKPEPGLRRAALAALVVVGMAAGTALVLAPVGHSASAAGDRCAITEDIAPTARPMPHVAARIAAGGTLTIVALGSSSTSGTGASSADRTYPSRLGALYADRIPGLAVRVINRGVAGEEAPAMAARLGRDVLPEKPDLVIWQVGTNGVLRGDDADVIGEIIRAGVARIKAAGADVMIMNPQYAPAMLRHSDYRHMLHVLDAVAYAEDVPLFPRFAMMRHWAEDGLMPLNVMLTRDRLHMTDMSYDCLARQVATTIDGIARLQTIEARESSRNDG
jgi:lysophospholipase L1-like esterase